MLDPRLHPAALTDTDVETLRFFGVRAALLVCDGTPSSTQACIEQFDEVLRHVKRFRGLGLKAWAALGVHPQAAPRRGLHDVLAALVERLDKSVAALGLLGFVTGSAAEEAALVEQLALAKRFKLPLIITSTSGHR